MIAIIDYGVGNLFSIRSSLQFIGANAVVTGDAEKIRECDKIILPGVGAFSDAADKLRRSGLADLICDEARRGKPILGICLGMQLLFERSYEYGCHAGLGLIGGDVMPIEAVSGRKYKIPHIGWNALKFPAGRDASPLFKYIKEEDCVYFVHSYYAANCDDSVIAYTEYGADLTAAVSYKNVFGTQFHPEKSGAVGTGILRAFNEVSP